MGMGQFLLCFIVFLYFGKPGLGLGCSPVEYGLYACSGGVVLGRQAPLVFGKGACVGMPCGRTIGNRELGGV